MFSKSGSVVVLATPIVFVIAGTEPVSGVRTIVMTAVWPLANALMLEVSVVPETCGLAPVSDVAENTVVLAGSKSVRTTPLALLGPKLVTSIV